MNYCCESLSPTMSVLFCFVFLFWSLLCEKEIGFQLNIYWYELLLWIPFSNNFFFLFLFLSFCLLFFSFGAFFVPKKLVSNSICISMDYCCGPLSPTISFLFCFVFLFWSLLCEKQIGFQLNIYWYELLLWIPFSNNVIFSSFFFLSFCFLFSFLEPPLCQRNWFPTQYVLVCIIVVNLFLQQCHFCFVLFFSFGVSFGRKRLVFNSTSIDMNYCCGSFSNGVIFFFSLTMLFSHFVLFFVFLFWSLLYA